DIKTPPRRDAGAAVRPSAGPAVGSGGSVLGKARHFLFHLELFFLEPGEGGGIRQGALAFLDDPGFETGMPGLKGRNVCLVPIQALLILGYSHLTTRRGLCLPRGRQSNTYVRRPAEGLR